MKIILIRIKIIILFHVDKKPNTICTYPYNQTQLFVYETLIDVISFDKTKQKQT